MKRPFQVERGTTGRRVSWVQHAIGPANVTGPRLALAAGLIVALAFVEPAGSLAQQTVTLSFVTGAPVPAAIVGGGLVQAPAYANADQEGATAADTVSVDSLSAAPDAEPSNPPATSAGGDETRMAGRPAIAAGISDVFPFAQNEVPETFPSFGLSIGVGGYLSGFATVERAFHAIEDAYRAGGFFVPRAGDVRLGPMVLPTLKVRLNQWLDVGFQMGRAGDGTSDKVKLMGGLVSGRYALSRAGKVSLFAGLGGGTYRFSFRRGYGVQVTPIDGRGGYYELDAIMLEGGGGYWTTVGGLTIRALPRGTLEALVQYVGTDDVSTDASQAGEVRLNMSGAMIGVSITSYF